MNDQPPMEQGARSCVSVAAANGPKASAWRSITITMTMITTMATSIITTTIITITTISTTTPRSPRELPW